MQAGARDYQEISFSRAALKRLYQLTLDADAAARADVGARPRRRAVGALRRAAGLARRRHARGRAGRFHSPAAGDVARRARRADRIVQHDDVAARRCAVEDRGIAARHGDDARVSRKRARQPVVGRARLRRSLPAAHGESERRRASCSSRLPNCRACRSPSGAGGCRRSRRSAELVAEGFRGARDGQWQREAELDGRRADAHAADARHAAAWSARAGLCRGLRRRFGAIAGAARRRLGGGRAPACARDQESADADPAVRGAAGCQARVAARWPTTRKCCAAERRRSCRRSRR